MGGAGLPETGAVDGGAEGIAAPRGLCGRRGGVRFPCRYGETGSAMDAEERSGMVVPHLPGAGKTAQAVREAQQPVRVVCADGQMKPFFRSAFRSCAAGYFILVPFSCGFIMGAFGLARAQVALSLQSLSFRFILSELYT